jgi:hypothetical protein
MNDRGGWYPVIPGDQPGGAPRIKITIQIRRRGAVLAQRQLTLAPDDGNAVDARAAVDALAARIGALFGITFDPEVRR